MAGLSPTYKNMFLKNKITASIGQFENHQGTDWQELTQSEIEAYELTNAKTEKITQIKGTAASLILATYPTHKQLNTLMSEDAALIEAMDIFISAIRTKSNELEAELGLLTDPEEIKNFPIQF
jgi:hypothetical protein